MSRLLLLCRIFKNYIDNIYAYFQFKKLESPESPIVFFDLTGRRAELYYYLLIFSFHEAGYTIFLKHNFMFIGNCLKAGQQIFRLPRLKVGLSIKKTTIQNTILITDHLSGYLNYPWRKVININFDVYSPKNKIPSHVTMPYPMSPDQYATKRFKQITGLRESNKKMRIFFSGNQDKKAYNHPVIEEFFHKISRYQVMEILINTLTSDELLLIEQKEQWLLLEGGYCNKLVLNRWTWSPEMSSNLESRVTNDQWLATLAQSAFFLATPGIRMPLCFNVVEAMAVGAIPILQYPEYFDPPLEHLKNCLIFENKDDLLEKIRSALSMSEKEINSLRINVADYYDQFLQIDRLPSMIEKLEAHTINLYLNAEEVSYQDYLKNNAKGV
uniref:Glycosyltransferase n=1 Tax=Roseihalotalea indica TaxID=2867963 RepID=A0AA49JGC8_9BACT|nr:glycosyltransferase [Tunicatimonas sp. TK19036]